MKKNCLPFILKLPKNMFEKIRQFNNNQGVVALLLVVMIATLTLVSSVILTIANTSDLVSNYQLSESTLVNVEIDSCIDDALYRISSSSDVTGTFSLDVGDVYCDYEISAISNGIKYVTSTASSTSALGTWSRTVITAVNVSSSPISIYSYKDSVTSFDSFATCGNGAVEGDEVCDDGNLITEQCGDSIQHIGNFCSSDCMVAYVANEACDSDLTKPCSLAPDYFTNYYIDDVQDCSKGMACKNDCTKCYDEKTCGAPK